MIAPSAATRREAALLSLLIFIGAVVYLLLNASRRVPDLMIDEILYGQMAQGVAGGEGATWRGQSTGVQSAYSYLIAPGWVVGDGQVGGYVLGRSIGVVTVCLTAIGAWLLGREVVEGGWKWIVPVGSLAGSWMVFSGRLLTENLAYPLATATLATLVVALARGRDRRWLAAAAALSLAACAVRMQLLILPVTVVAAVIVDLARTGRTPFPGRIARSRGLIAAGVGGLLIVSVFVTVVFALDPLELLGRYRSAVDESPVIGTWIYWISNCAVELTLMCGVIPAIALVGLASRRANWRDSRVGALLAVAVPFTLLLLAQVAWFSAADSPRLIDRYLVYAAPLLLAALAVAPGRVDALRGGTAAIVLAGLALALPMPDGLSRESDALLAAIVRVAGGGPANAADSLRWVAVFLALTGVAGAVLLDDRSRRRAPSSLAVLLTAAVLVVGAQHSWQSARAGATAVASLVPPQRDWIDRAEVGSVGMFSVGGSSAEQGYLTEFFNDSVVGAYVLAPMEAPPAGAGFACVLRAAADGTLALKRGSPDDCQPPPRALLPRGETTGVLFATERQVVGPREPAERGRAEVIVNSSPPRLSAVFDTGCGAFVRACRVFASLRGWLDRPATATVTMRGGKLPCRVRMGGVVWSVPSRRTVSASFKLPAGRRVARAAIVSAVSEDSMPRVTKVELARDGEDAGVLYSAAN